MMSSDRTIRVRRSILRFLSDLYGQAEAFVNMPAQCHSCTLNGMFSLSFDGHLKFDLIYLVYCVARSGDSWRQALQLAAICNDADFAHFFRLGRFDAALVSIPIVQQANDTNFEPFSITEPRLHVSVSAMAHTSLAVGLSDGSVLFFDVHSGKRLYVLE